jgi:hypothetical protein
MSKPDEQEASSSQADGAQGVPPPHAAELRGKLANPPFHDLHGRSVAVRVPVPGGEQVLLGNAEYATDPDLGQVLRVAIEGSGGLEIVLSETVFHGQILSGDAHQRDYLIDVTAKSSADLPSPKLPKA